MVGDKKLSQGKIAQVPNLKERIPLFIIEYDLNHVSDLKAENILKELHSSNSARKLLKKEFSEYTRRDIIFTYMKNMHNNNNTASNIGRRRAK